MDGGDGGLRKLARNIAIGRWTLKQERAERSL
jgi:hypothetical protein